MNITKLWSPAISTAFDMEVVERAVDMTIDLLSPYLGQARPLRVEELRVPVGTSPGVLGAFLGCKDKVDALQRYGYLLEEFLEYAHQDMYVPLYSEVQKVDELLPLEKLEIGKVRTFIIPDFIVWAAQTMLFYDMDTYLKKCPYIAVGYNKFSGGYKNMYEYLRRGELFASEDCTQYDRSLWSLFMYVVMAVRLQAFKPAYEQHNDKVPYYVALSFINFRRLPDGMLVMKEDGLSSGAPTTSTDGSICHIFADCYAWLRCENDPILYPREMFPCFYSDDSIRACMDTPECTRFLNHMIEYYGELGLKVKPFEITRELLGRQFLGCTFRIVEGHLVPVFDDTAKAIDSLYQPKGKYNIDQEFGRVLSLYQECYWNQEVRHVCSAYLRFLKLNGATGSIPTSTEMKERWFGYE